MAELKNGNDGLEERNIIIIGGGTAGFAAGVYTSRAMLEPLLITGDALGGQLSLTLDLENYPGLLWNRSRRVYIRDAETSRAFWDRGKVRHGNGGGL